jgi:predicted RNase H-like HicB family nuclease
MRYTIIIEKGPDSSYGAYVPDLPGCAAVGDSAAKVRRLITEGIGYYLEELQERGEKIPEPVSVGDYVEVDLPQLRRASRRSKPRSRRRAV